jgi:hemoglobin
MSQFKSARVGIAVLAIAVIAGVGLLLWVSRSDDTATGAEAGARSQEERARTPAPELEKGGDEAAGQTKVPPPAGEALHDRIGGREAIHAMIGKLLEAVQRNQVIMANEKVREAAKRVNVRKLHQRITNYLCKEAGGPCKYTERPMKEYLAQLELTSAEWDALDEELVAILAEMKVPESEAQELMALIDALEDDSAAAD